MLHDPIAQPTELACHFSLNFKGEVLDLSKLTECIQLKPNYLFALALASGLILFLPREVLDAISLRQLAVNHREWIGIVFLLSSVLLVSTEWV